MSAPATGITLDAAALIALERGDERVIALLRAARARQLPIVVPAGALAQAWRGGARQARLASFLRVRDGRPRVVALEAANARAAGELCGRRGISDVIDASVVLCGRAYGHHVVTGDPDDLRRLDPGVPLIVV